MLLHDLELQNHEPRLLCNRLALHFQLLGVFVLVDSNLLLEEVLEVVTGVQRVDVP